MLPAEVEVTHFYGTLFIILKHCYFVYKEILHIFIYIVFNVGVY